MSLELYADGPRDNKLASRVTVRLKNGREILQDAQYFPGMPQQPLSAGQLWNKFELLTTSYAPGRARQIFDRMGELDKVEDVRELELGKP